MLPLIGVVEIFAIVAPIITWSPPSLADLDLAIMLASLSVTYSVFVIGWEKARRVLLFERAPSLTPDLLATWCFAAAIILPPTLAAAVTAVSALGDWPSYNPAGTRPLYRYLYSTMAAAVLAARAASWTVRHDLPLAVSLAAAGAVWIAIGAGATILAMCASGQFAAARAMLHPDAHRIEVTTMAVAISEYAAFRLGFRITDLDVAAGRRSHSAVFHECRAASQGIQYSPHG